jgi:septal ring factor EnvC (AmiA/AmiB activator)
MSDENPKILNDIERRMLNEEDVLKRLGKIKEAVQFEINLHIKLREELDKEIESLDKEIESLDKNLSNVAWVVTSLEASMTEIESAENEIKTTLKNKEAV